MVRFERSLYSALIRENYNSYYEKYGQAGSIPVVTEVTEMQGASHTSFYFSFRRKQHEKKKKTIK